MQSSSNGTGRRRHVSMACTHCRMGKIKCDGATPACSNCKNKGKGCTYPTGDDRRKHSPRNAIETLLSRNNQLCQFIHSHNLQPPPMTKEKMVTLVRVLEHLKIPHAFDGTEDPTQAALNNDAPFPPISITPSETIALSQSQMDIFGDEILGEAQSGQSPSVTTSDIANKQSPALDFTGDVTNIQLNESSLPDNDSPSWTWNAPTDLNSVFQPSIAFDADAWGEIFPFPDPTLRNRPDGTHAPTYLQAEGDDDCDGTEALIDKLSKRVGSLKIEPKGQIRYYGHFSNFSLLAGIPTTDDGTAYRDIRREGQEHLDRLDIGKPVPIPLEEHLESLYFAWVNPSLHLVDRAIFENGKAKWRNNHERTPYYSEALQNSVCSLGAAFEPKYHPTFVTFPKALSEFFADRAKSLLDLELDSPSLATVQALTLISSYDISCKRDSRGWLYSGMAIRLAFDMALHIDLTPYVNTKCLTQAEADMRRDIFWAVFTTDHMWGFYLGRPFRINMDDVTVAKPSGSDTQASSKGKWVPYAIAPSKVEPMAIPDYMDEVHRQRVLMSETVAPVGYTLYGNLKTSRSTLQKMNARTVAKLLEWKTNLPFVLQVNLDDHETLYLPHVLLLHMQYHQNIIHAHRPWMSKTYLQPTPPQGPGANHARMMCMESAYAIAKLLQLYETHYPLKKMSFQAVGIISSASLLLVFAKVTDYQCQQKCDIGLHLSTCFRALDELSATWSSSRRADRFLLSLQKRWELQGHSNRVRRISVATRPNEFPRKRTRSSAESMSKSVEIQQSLANQETQREFSEGPQSGDVESLDWDKVFIDNDDQELIARSYHGSWS